MSENKKQKLNIKKGDNQKKQIIVQIYDQEGKKKAKIDLNPKIFGLEINPDLIHQAVVVQMANSRQVVAKTKDRGEVRGGGRKPWRQKGTGRARHGSIRSPIWRGGGVTFGPTTDRVFSRKINKKMKRKALAMVFSGKLRDNELIILDDLKIDKPKTKLMIDFLSKFFKNLGIGNYRSALLVLPKKEENVIRASRNIPKFNVIAANSLNVVDILKHKYLILLKDDLKIIEKIFYS